MAKTVEHTGYITKINDKTLEVSIIQVSACSDCHAKGACSASDMDEKIIEVSTDVATFALGEKVVLTGKTKMGFLAVLLAFVIPFLLILTSLFVTRLYITDETISGTLSLAVLIPYYVILSFFNKKLKNTFQFQVSKAVA